MKKITLVGYFAGLIIILASISRWFVIYNDPSQAVIGASIGIIILGSSYVYQRLVDLTEDIKDVNRGLDTFNIWTRGELKKLGAEI